jgi:hypothetical protein
MGNTVGVFDFEIGIAGASVIARSKPLCAGCLSDAEIDAHIKLLKDDLDAVAERMKAAVRKQASNPSQLW